LQFAAALAGAAGIRTMVVSPVSRITFASPLVVVALLLLVAGPAGATSKAYEDLWSDPNVQQRIDAGIEANRKADLTLSLVDGAGRPVQNATVRIVQQKHAFSFGSNSFVFDQFDTAAKNQKYREQFGTIFNAATLGIYWKSIEPQQGQYRFTAGSSYMYRRPPTDPVVDYMVSRGVTVNAHPIVWDSPTASIPDWLPDDLTQREQLINERIRVLAERYGSTIKRWDVLNEPYFRKTQEPMPDDFIYKSFVEANRYLPATAELQINEASTAWTEARTYYKNLIQSLTDRGARVDRVGLQFHLFNDTAMKDVTDGKTYKPLDLLSTLDTYATLGKPIYISEITIPATGGTSAGRADQAEVARNLYRLWFSHAAVDGITWWNLVDNTAASGETPHAGLLDTNLDPKEAYLALQQLIQDEWWSDVTSVTDASGLLNERLFRGEYLVEVLTADGRRITTPLSLSGGGLEATITVPEPGAMSALAVVVLALARRR
jgi:endo-1,4-beta-xylanase